MKNYTTFPCPVEIKRWQFADVLNASLRFNLPRFNRPAWLLALSCIVTCDANSGTRAARISTLMGTADVLICGSGTAIAAAQTMPISFLAGIGVAGGSTTAAFHNYPLPTPGYRIDRDQQVQLALTNGLAGDTFTNIFALIAEETTDNQGD